MFIQIHKKYLYKKFFKKICNVSVVFLILVVIVNILEETSFLKGSNASIYMPFLLTLLNGPSLLYQMFPFIFLISTQLFYIEIYKSGELDTLNKFNFNKFDLIKVLFKATLLLSFIIVIIFYNFSSILKKEYLITKNSFSNDDKYLAVITKNGLWIKDNLNDGTIIINSKKIQDNYLIDTSITKLNFNFEIDENIISKKIDISNNDWIIYNPIIADKNNFSKKFEQITLKSNFNINKINNLFSDLSSLTFFGLLKLEKDYKSIGYSTDEIKIKKHKLYSFPPLLLSMSLIGLIIMLIFKQKKQLLWSLLVGVFFSVTIYYITNLSNILGENNRISIVSSVWLPIIILFITSIIGSIKFNEK
jgi:lipopolysaccharide export system permease protein